jgi:protein ImuA
LRGLVARIEAAPAGSPRDEAEPGLGAQHGLPPATHGFTLGAALPDPVLARAALHEVAAREAGDGAAAFAFALGLALRALQAQASVARVHAPLLLVLDEAGCREAGHPYGHGLAGFGLDPDNLLIVRTRQAIETLWAFEEGLRCGALGGALAVFGRLPRAYDLTASRRLVLSAREGGVPGCLAIIGEGGAGERLASAAQTRWRIAARPSPPGLAGEPTAMCLTADLLRRRGGEPSTYELEWLHDQHGTERRGFVPCCAKRAALPGRARERPALSVPAPALSADRPHHAARAG